MSFPSFFALLFAGGALRRRRALARWLPAFAFFLTTLLGSGMAQATVYTFAGGAVDTCTLSNKVYTCPYPAYLDWDDAVVIGSGYTLKVTTSVTVTYNQGLTMQAGSRLVVTGNLDIKGINPPNLKVADGSFIDVGGKFSMGDLKQSLSADITANDMSLGTDAITINGNLTSKTSIAIGSYATIKGDISGTIITTSAPVKITGNVTATTSFSLASGSTVTGTVDTGSLVLESSEALIDGSAYVNTARLEYHGRVSGIIYCKNGTAKNKCDCVTNNSGYAVNKTNGPTCEAPSPKTPHHFLITHDGQGDTCLPEKITVTACANATCTAPHFAGTVSGRLTGTGDAFTIAENAGSVVVNATRIAAGAVTFGLSELTLAPDTGLACYRSDNNSNSCVMNFSGGAKLKLTVSPHPAATDNILAMVAAVKANDDNTACIAAFQGVAHDVQYSCNYSKPKTGTLPVALGGQSLSCAASGATAAAKTISTSFNMNGIAQLPVKYADAGEVTLNALLDNQKGVAKGEGKIVTAPASFLIEPATGTIRAGAEFDLKLTARNVAGATTPNFDTADLNSASGVNHAVALGVDCHKQGGSLGTVAPASPAFTDGVAALKATWSDVGHIDLKVSLTDFLGSGLKVANTTNTAAAGSCSGKVGPFIPAYFKVELADTRGFYYSGEPFPLRVSAMNKAGAVTLNYTNSLALSEALTLTAVDKDGVAFATAPGVLADAAITAAQFENGVTSSATPVKPKYTFNTWPNAPTQVRLRASNGKPAGTDVVSSAPAGAEAAIPQIRTGRLRIGSRFGGLKANLSIPVTAEYWTGKSWLLNGDDGFTTIPRGAFALKPTVSGMAVSATFADPLMLVNGAAAFNLSVSAGGPGPVEIAVNLGSFLQDNTCIGNTVGTGLATNAANKPWLRPVVTGCGGTMARDPSGRATFGVYTPENRRIIHVREVFN
ncbi:polymer-forming cytoskeletal protein [Massilia sp. 9I]|uniref:polymer-forming cytoskeletal protein n=1 Tax=Massilia sp. 9I TaxID=2653152 RepID=UPI00135971CA|nr:polymer-forming cytoskeletal protein [Massilia sp. 9I]